MKLLLPLLVFVILLGCKSDRQSPDRVISSGNFLYDIVRSDSSVETWLFDKLAGMNYVIAEATVHTNGEGVVVSAHFSKDNEKVKLVMRFRQTSNDTSCIMVKPLWCDVEVDSKTEAEGDKFFNRIDNLFREYEKRAGSNLR